jgi:hypothetical protein
MHWQPSGQEPPSDHELSHLSRFTGANELERLVSVDEFSAVDDPLLRQTPYVVNTHDLLWIYSQATGRVSRDNFRGDPSAIKGQDPFGEDQTLQDGGTICRRLRLALFLDGAAVPCAMLPSGQSCDVCTKQASEAPPPGLTLFHAHLMPKTHSAAGGMSDDPTPSPSHLPTSITQGGNVSCY